MINDLDYLGIFKEFNKKKIKYIICGGIAVNLLGIPRMTYDIDILVKMDDNNLKKLLNLFKLWGFKPKVPVEIMDFAIKEKRDDWIKNKNMKAFCLINPKWAISEIDILIDTPVDYKKAINKVVYKRIENITIPVVCINQLIKMKKDTGRRQDKADIKYLKEL